MEAFLVKILTEISKELLVYFPREFLEGFNRNFCENLDTWKATIRFVQSIEAYFSTGLLGQPLLVPLVVE